MSVWNLVVQLWDHTVTGWFPVLWKISTVNLVSPLWKWQRHFKILFERTVCIKTYTPQMSLWVLFTLRLRWPWKPFLYPVKVQDFPKNVMIFRHLRLPWNSPPAPAVLWPVDRLPRSPRETITAPIKQHIWRAWSFLSKREKRPNPTKLPAASLFQMKDMEGGSEEDCGWLCCSGAGKKHSPCKATGKAGFPCYPLNTA